ncbi:MULTISPECIES: type II toxin-antitoxin system antitoxin DNA ADP-ribosyl glycohydrolase DarG [Mesorhizobium]|uniref:Macro domain-containing protein n=1 Tax=Mesorhizobium montanum TaxID=3072323 RepID=A0ABU4ZSL6_9HYPH|nr:MULTISPECIES: macro domain-containing protein [unclassified Mesorhizobium]MDX8508605.1 macro domain-containing protein [Mesorhizobium sp. VK22E]MDX8528010.1 macro domain-containing protein [Mesorhizobium sp. MSK_1335]
MVKFVRGNLLEADTEALVNTVNTVGVMGKGVALMFKEAFPENFKLYEAACEDKRVRLGEMFVTERNDLYGPKWIINFPTKAHWRYPSKIEWIANGLDNLKAVLKRNNIKSIAIPPLGAGNGGLEWQEVRELILSKLDPLKDVEVVVYEPTHQYQNVAKRTGVDKLTPARALIAELVRRYCILGIQCSLLEVQKLGYFVERFANREGLDAMKFEFGANKYGPYSDKMKHMLNALDGSYLHCDKRLGDAGPFEPIHFDDERKEHVSAYFSTAEAKPYRSALEATSRLIDGFESPLGMELLATVDWLVHHEKVAPQVAEIREALPKWPGGEDAAERKLRLFDDRIVKIALDALKENSLVQAS